MSTPLKAAIVGAGRGRSRPLLQVHPDTNRGPSTATRRCATVSRARDCVRRSLSRDALCAPSPDAVFVCTPTHTHLAVVREYLKQPCISSSRSRLRPRRRGGDPEAGRRGRRDARGGISNTLSADRGRGTPGSSRPACSAAAPLHARLRGEVFSAKGWFFQKARRRRRSREHGVAPDVHPRLVLRSDPSRDGSTRSRQHGRRLGAGAHDLREWRPACSTRWARPARRCSTTG
jgi:hypothetical protein